MTNGILIIAHAPLASALRQCVLHVFPECATTVLAVDVQAHHSLEDGLALAKTACHQLGSREFLVLTDIIGATPWRVAKDLVDGEHSRLVAGVNLSMLLRAVTYRNESLNSLVNRALVGGMEGVKEVQTENRQLLS